MGKRIDIKPPNWTKELTFEEFKKLNPLINENQIVHLYNQYLAKFLNELRQQKIHYKQSLNKNLQLEINKFQKKYNQTLLDTEFKLPNMNYDDPRGAGNPPYGKGLGASGEIRFVPFTPVTEVIVDRNFASGIAGRVLTLQATNGTFHNFTVTSNVSNGYIPMLSQLTSQINNHPLFTAQLAVNITIPGTKTLAHIISIQQYLPGSAGNTALGGNLETAEILGGEVPLVTYVDFTGGTDG